MSNYCKLINWRLSVCVCLCIDRRNELLIIMKLSTLSWRVCGGACVTHAILWEHSMPSIFGVANSSACWHEGNHLNSEKFLRSCVVVHILRKGQQIKRTTEPNFIECGNDEPKRIEQNRDWITTDNVFFSDNLFIGYRTFFGIEWKHANDQCFIVLHVLSVSLIHKQNNQFILLLYRISYYMIFIFRSSVAAHLLS